MTDVYLVLVLLVASNGAQAELSREVVKASTPAVCQAHADKLADKRRAADAEMLRRFGSRIVGECRKVAQ
jgi:hypothetical protein